jgi:Rha family phage regulatory protein
MSLIVKTNTEPLVRNYGEVSVTDSRLVAKRFGVEHKNLLRLIDGLITEEELVCCEEVGRLTSEPSSGGVFDCFKSEYLNEQNKPQPMYLLTEAGFILTAMASKSEEAKRWRRQFIEAFQSMRDALLELEREKARFAIVETQHEISIAFRDRPVKQCAYYYKLKQRNVWSEYTVDLLCQILTLAKEGKFATHEPYKMEDFIEIIGGNYANHKHFFRTLLHLDQKQFISLFVAKRYVSMILVEPNIIGHLMNSSTLDREEDWKLDAFRVGFFKGYHPYKIWKYIQTVEKAVAEGKLTSFSKMYGDS